jgi:alginate O-acetyltransferase complex protein AlgI
VPRTLRSHALSFWGAVFYLYYAPSALWLAAGLVPVAFFVAGPRAKWIAIGLVMGLLAWFKVSGEWLEVAGSGGVTQLTGGALIPLGFSFLSLELVHYSMERGRGRIREASLVDLAAFALFFPCRIAGPIKRYADFTASVANAELLPQHATQGCLRILSGLVKKVAADFLGRAAASPLAAARPLDAWESMLAFSLQLFLDFSAYSDIAIGISRLMGITVPENFRSPYLSANIQEFWTRWHMSLSSWVREYIFLSLGRVLFKTRLKRYSAVIAAISYLAAFLFVGAWHGLTPNYMVWGAYHGVLLAAYHLYKTSIPLSLATSAVYQSRLVSWSGTALTFLAVLIGWVFFRMELDDSARLLRLMFNL